MQEYKKTQKGIVTIIIVLLVIVGLGVIGGGITYFAKNKESQEKKAGDINPERNQASVFQFDEMPQGTLDDLTIGETVTVRGGSNQDGSITAEMIFIGIMEGDFQNRPDFSSEDREENMERPSLPEGFNPEEFRNLSSEERRERMQEFMGDREVPDMGNRMGRMGSGTGFVQGEIINKDEISITVKLVDGGSKLVFYSEDTRIIIQERDINEN